MRGWIEQAEIKCGAAPWATTDAASEPQALGREERRAALDERDPEDGVGVFRGGARPSTALIVAYIEAYRDRFRAGLSSAL